jgi:hypothetical protein
MNRARTFRFLRIRFNIRTLLLIVTALAFLSAIAGVYYRATLHDSRKAVERRLVASGLFLNDPVLPGDFPSLKYTIRQPSP